VSETPTMYRASADFPAFVTGQTLPKTSFAPPNREAALLSLFHLKPEYLDRLLALSAGEWRRVIHWLDVSGLTLYFAHQVKEFSIQASLPIAVSQGLQQRLSDNRVRIRGLLQESAELQAEFQRANISYAVLKGFSLYPSSVPMLELRHQLDLDFLVDESGVSKAQEILLQAGYRLHGISGNSREFKKNDRPRFSTKNMYKDGFGHSVEIHIESVEAGRESLLSRREYREIEGVTMPVLAPADLFLIQGMHAFKDVCGAQPRASHLLEFYRHVCARGDDPHFWSDVRSRAQEDPRSILGLGVVLQVIESVMKVEIPSKLAMWTMLRIPVLAQRWIALYGLKCVYGTPPGTKLYLLLQRELEAAGMTFKRPARAVLLPTRLPHVIIPATADETLGFRAQRYAAQLQFILRRLRFHVVEGLRYAWASYRWRRHRNEPSA
jgi:hypothetical protein